MIGFILVFVVVLGFFSVKTRIYLAVFMSVF